MNDSHEDEIFRSTTILITTIFQHKKVNIAEKIYSYGII